MYKTHIFDQKNNVKFFFYQPTYPIFFRPLQETNFFSWPYIEHENFKYMLEIDTFGCLGGGGGVNFEGCGGVQVMPRGPDD